jgi:hypothetical protein
MAAPRGVGDAAKGSVAACVGVGWRSDAAIFTGINAFTSIVVRRTASATVGGRRVVLAAFGSREVAGASRRTAATCCRCSSRPT